jgi:predicted O-linked N-acetylglucosamine transferase (SPINDLY family)
MNPRNQLTKQNPHFLKAVACHQAGLLTEAISHYKKAVKSMPKNANLLTTLGGLALQTGNLDDAIKFNNQAIRIDPKQLIAHAHLGSGYAQLNKFEEALACCNRALQLKPDFIEVYFNRGKILEDLKRYAEAVTSYDQALSFKADLPEAHFNRGNALYKLKRFAEAVASYDLALTLRPAYAAVYSNRGNALRELNQPEQAEASYQQAIALNPLDAEAYNNLGMLFYNRKQYDAAWQCFDRAIKLNPDLTPLYALRIFSKLQICHLQGLEADFSELAAKFKTNRGICEPFLSMTLIDDPALHRQIAEQWTADINPATTLPGNLLHPEHNKIRLAYFSADFHHHPVAYLTAELFETHDRNRFEITAFSYGANTQDDMRTRLESGFDRFIDVQNLSDQDVVQLARELEIDIAIDLGGHTADARTKIFAMRAAPIQLSYIGFLGTMGAEYMDYLLADPVIIPAAAQQHYVEKIVYLPSYQANDTQRRIADTVFSREQLGLPAQGFVFCCFNNNYKITAETFAGWMQILQQVPESVLLLLADNDTAKQNLRNAAVLQGVAAERLVFGQRLPAPEYLARYRTADLFLDTLPYNAGTTASDALWAGLPVLTRSGKSFASRIAASLLSAIGLPELITDTQADYEQLAIELATHPQQLAAIKTKLAQNRLSTPLFDIQQFTRHLETGYTLMYQRYRSGLPPTHLHIAETSISATANPV